MRDVVVAVRDIPARKAIEEGDVVVRELVADPTNETAFAALDEVLGRVAGVPVATGQLFTRTCWPRRPRVRRSRSWSRARSSTPRGRTCAR